MHHASLKLVFCVSGRVFWMYGLVFWVSGLQVVFWCIYLNFVCLDLYFNVWTCIWDVNPAAGADAVDSSKDIFHEQQSMIMHLQGIQLNIQSTGMVDREFMHIS